MLHDPEHIAALTSGLSLCACCLFVYRFVFPGWNLPSRTWPEPVVTLSTLYFTSQMQSIDFTSGEYL